MPGINDTDADASRPDRAGVPTVVRDTQGKDIDAACGQLWLRDLGG